MCTLAVAVVLAIFGARGRAGTKRGETRSGRQRAEPRGNSKITGADNLGFSHRTVTLLGSHSGTGARLPLIEKFNSDYLLISDPGLGAVHLAAEGMGEGEPLRSQVYKPL
jgi:hypothetical protein